jgi:DNA-binding response OmpR family regulator
MHSHEVAMEKILIVEDELDVRENLIEILEIAQYEVLSASDGLEGLKLTKSFQPDLILCDIMMPKMDGYEMLAALREDQETETTPVIFLTAKTEYSDQRQGMELGADDYLTKPFEIDKLFLAIRSRLNKREGYLRQLEEAKETSKKSRRLAQQSQSLSLEQEEIMAIKDQLLLKIASNLGQSITNVNLALSMLNNNHPTESQQKYLNILQQECHKQIQILDEMMELQTILTPQNLHLLKRYNLLQI